MAELLSPKECLKEAEKCERLAASASDLQAKHLFQEAAAHWRKLAEAQG